MQEVLDTKSFHVPVLNFLAKCGCFCPLKKKWHSDILWLPCTGSHSSFFWEGTKRGESSGFTKWHKVSPQAQTKDTEMSKIIQNWVKCTSSCVPWSVYLTGHSFNRKRVTFSTLHILYEHGLARGTKSPLQHYIWKSYRLEGICCQMI